MRWALRECECEREATAGVACDVTAAASERPRPGGVPLVNVSVEGLNDVCQSVAWRAQPLRTESRLHLKGKHVLRSRRLSQHMSGLR